MGTGLFQINCIDFKARNVQNMNRHEKCTFFSPMNEGHGEADVEGLMDLTAKQLFMT